MSYQPGTPVERNFQETFNELLSQGAKLLLIVGAIATLASASFLVFTFFRLNDPAANATAGAAINNVGFLQKTLMAGALCLFAGSTYLFWGSEFLGVSQVGVSALAFFAPLFIPSLAGSGTSTEAQGAALGALQQAGGAIGLLSLIVLMIDIGMRVKERSINGTKADQIKYGKGVKEEKGFQNVFMGKCWQLPFCRKFVREKCPIYHAKRTCWKERVGCMCEESVIQGAMEGRAIPKNSLLAAKMIPRNNRLTEVQKWERCKSCVIYNEHQKHKYRLSLPTSIVAFGLVYVIFRVPLLESTSALITKINELVKTGTLGASSGAVPPAFFNEFLLVCFFVVGLAYTLRTLEFLFFKVKI